MRHIVPVNRKSERDSTLEQDQARPRQRMTHPPSTLSSPPTVFALEFRRSITYADETHRREVSSWGQYLLDPRMKAGLAGVLNNEVHLQA